MQKEAIRQIYSVEKQVMESEDSELIKAWERLQTSDHYYYMCTKFWNDGDVHKYFSPFDSPYDAYLYFMNVFSDLERRLGKRKKVKKIVQSTKTSAIMPVPNSVGDNKPKKASLSTGDNKKKSQEQIKKQYSNMLAYMCEE